MAGRRAEIIAAVIAAVYANLWMNDGLVMSDTLSTLCITGLLLAVYAYLDRPSRSGAAGDGAADRCLYPGVGGDAPCPPPGRDPGDAHAQVRGPTHLGERWLRLGAVVGVLVLTLAPWTLYNATRFDRPVLISTNDGLTLLGANCPNTYFGPGLGFWSLQCAEALPAPATEDQSEHGGDDRARGPAYMWAHLSRLPAVALAREGRVWSVWRVGQMVWLNTGEGRERWASRIGVVQLWLLVPVAVAGSVVLRRRHVALLPLLAMFAGSLASWPSRLWIPRFRIPAEVATVVLAAAATSIVA